MNHSPSPISIRQAFGNAILKLAKTDKHLYVVDADLKSSLFLNKFAKKYPRRFIECGVAESNAAGVAAGLAKSGKTVFLTSFACFSPAINWAVIKQSICYNHANVKIIGSHAGLMSADLGATHQMLEDVALMRALPNMQVFAPLDAVETEKIITVAARSPLPCYVRLVRPATQTICDPKLPFTIGKSHLLTTGKDVTVVGYGPVLLNTLEVKGFKLEIINCSSVKPLDSETIIKSVKKTGRLLCLEDHQKNGGLGEAVASLLLSSSINCRFAHLAVDNRFGRSAQNYHELYEHYHLDLSSINFALHQLMESSHARS
ncbi:MAG: transketolase C-terminal domain-containing protein [Candidatus Shapirobacteria bacterium]